MKIIYSNIKRAVFLDRPNRFIANITIDGKEEVCHVKNTGRCKELLLPNAEIYVQHSTSPGRKTAYDLIAVKKGERLVNIDSQVPNRVVEKWLEEKNPFGKITYIKPECKYGSSRFDFYFEAEGQRAFAEVKGVTLENDGVVSFPDAPSERAVKHIKELISAAEQGYKCYVIFVIQMNNVRYFTPNYQNHRQFGEILKTAADKGITVTAIDSIVTQNSIEAGSFVEVVY